MEREFPSVSPTASGVQLIENRGSFPSKIIDQPPIGTLIGRIFLARSGELDSSAGFDERIDEFRYN